MRKLMLSLALVGALVVIMAGSAAAQTCYVRVYLGSPDDQQTAKSAIVQAINGALGTLDLALHSLTDDDLGDVIVRAARRGVNVRAILGAGQDQILGGQYEKLKRAGVSVVAVSQQVMFDHAFAIIDDQVVITGSYNWSDYSEKSRYDSMVIISCTAGESAVKAFVEEFDDLWHEFYVDAGTIATTPAFSIAMHSVVIHSVDPAGECIQLLNVTAAAIDITGWQISDLEGSYEFPLDTILYPDEPYEICNDTYNPTEDPRSLYLNDEHDQLLLILPDGRIIDEHVWGTPPAE